MYAALDLAFAIMTRQTFSQISARGSSGCSFARTRSREPLRGPGGIRSSPDSVRVTAPSPPHVGQALRSLPVPLHRGHVRLNFIAPAICVTLPEPLHCGQVTSPVPVEPVPWQ